MNSCLVPLLDSHCRRRHGLWSNSNFGAHILVKRNNYPVETSAQPRMQRGDRAAVRRPVRRHLLMAPWPDRRALERLCGTRDPMTARCARSIGHRGTTGEEAASGFSHSFVVSTSASLKPRTSIIIAVFLCSSLRSLFFSLSPCHGVSR
jgi:hypothetical protein